MNADAEVKLFLLGFLGIVRPQLPLNLLGALHSVDNGGKVGEECVTDGFDDYAVMFTHRLLDELIMDVQQPQHTGFISAHLAAEADDVRKHDRGQPPMLHVRRAVGVVLHRYRLFCWRCQAVNQPPALVYQWTQAPVLQRLYLIP
jgi:hypothetical protein